MTKPKRDQMKPPLLIRVAFTIAISLSAPAMGQVSTSDNKPVVPMALPPLADAGALERQVFHLLTVLDTLGYREPLAKSRAWQSVRSVRQGRIAKAVEACEKVADCRLEAFRWTPAEISASGTAISKALHQSTLLKALAAHLRATGYYARYDTLADDQLISHAWADAAATQNHIIDIYGIGRVPLYPAIDSISFDPASDMWRKLIIEATNQIMNSPEVRAPVPREDPGYRLALSLLHLNDRENAGFYSDLDSKWNLTARVRIARTNWTAFPATIILVLGDGPDRPGQSIGSFGKLRLEHAVRLYRAGVAPFIVVSGGNVHPANTPFNEAIEMKRALVTREGVPEDAIIIEPNARHTTTNFRNTVRLMVRYGIPLNRPALATTSEGHSLYAAGKEFDRKAKDEIGLIPRRLLKRMSPYDFTFLPDPISTHLDARDPLDP